MNRRLTRRYVMRSSLAAVSLSRFEIAPAQTETEIFSYPIGVPNRSPGDGFHVRHGYATENSWYLPAYLHTGEDWYAVEGDTAGVVVYAVVAGDVVFAGSDYPGRVVIVQHGADLFSMYGHLDYDLAIGEGDRVERGQPLGTVLARTDGRAPSHLHFEMRTFLTAQEVNGDAPRYQFACGYKCAPGPGYWPIDAPEHPSVMGWRNPTHVIGRHSNAGVGADVVAALTVPEEVDVWSAPSGSAGAEVVTSLSLRPGERFPLLAIDAGEEASEETSAEAYHLWYQLRLSDDTTGWVQAALPSTYDTGSDGRPSSVQFILLPAAGSD